MMKHSIEFQRILWLQPTHDVTEIPQLITKPSSVSSHRSWLASLAVAWLVDERNFMKTNGKYNCVSTWENETFCACLLLGIHEWKIFLFDVDKELFLSHSLFHLSAINLDCTIFPWTSKEKSFSSVAERKSQRRTVKSVNDFVFRIQVNERVRCFMDGKRRQKRKETRRDHRYVARYWPICVLFLGHKTESR